MSAVEFVYTGGLTREDASERLDAADVGVLALADRGESYAIPMGHALVGDRLLFRFGDVPDSRKAAFAAETTVATFTVFDYTAPDDSWSVVARGPIERIDLDPTDATVNERFPPFQLFDEAVDEVEYEFFALTIEELTGRETIEDSP